MITFSKADLQELRGHIADGIELTVTIANKLAVQDKRSPEATLFLSRLENHIDATNRWCKILGDEINKQREV